MCLLSLRFPNRPFRTTLCWSLHHAVNIFITEVSAHREQRLKTGPNDHLHACPTPHIPLTRTMLLFSAFSSSLCPSVCPNGSNQYDGMWSERREVRERTATRKEESNKVCAYFRPPSHPPTSTPSGPTHSTTRENICVGPTKRQEFYMDLGIKFNRRHGYTLLLYQPVSLITSI